MFVRLNAYYKTLITGTNLGIRPCIRNYINSKTVNAVNVNHTRIICEGVRLELFISYPFLK